MDPVALGGIAQTLGGQDVALLLVLVGLLVAALLLIGRGRSHGDTFTLDVAGGDTDARCRAFAHLVGCGPEFDADSLSLAVNASLVLGRCARCGRALTGDRGVDARDGGPAGPPNGGLAGGLPSAVSRG